MRRRLLSLTASLVLLLPAVLGPAQAGAARDQLASPAPAPAVPWAPASAFAAIALDSPNPQVPGGYEPVAQTQNARLYINRDDSKLIVEDRRNGKLWTSNPMEPLSDQKTILDDAVFQLNYTNARRQMTNLASSASEKPDLSFQSIQDGVRVVYDIPKLKLNITADYALKEEPRQDVPGQTLVYLQVTIPDGAVKEGGDCSAPTSTTCFMVVTLELLPLFGAAPIGSDGYILIPDESGAIVRFKPEYPQYRQRYSAQIYGQDAAAQAFMGTGQGGGQGQSTVFQYRPRLPLWGLKDGPAAYAGIVTEGEYQANVNGYLAGYITNANRASAEFIYRRQASIPRRRTLFVNRIEDNQIPGERQVRYVLLSGDDANYAGMAKSYRDYLIKSRGLKKLPDQAPRPELDINMGALRRSAFNDQFIPMTTFDQTIQMLQGFLDRGVRDFDVNLIGWNDGGSRGYWPRRYPAEQDLGGNEGLRRLTDFAHKNGIRIYLADNYLFGYLVSSGGIFGQLPGIRNLWPNWSYGFNSRFDTIRGVNKLPVFSGSRTGRGQNLGLYLLNPIIARDNYAHRDFPTHKKLGADGIVLNYMGRLLMSDTNERYPLSRGEVAESWMKLLDDSRQLLGAAQVEGSNGYVIGRTDRIYDAPVDSLDAFGDVAVPTYHIATQGLAVRTTWAVNLRNDPKTEILRQIEWGLQPIYYLTNQPAADLIRANAFVYSSQYEDWVEPATAEYKKMRDEFGYLTGKFITNHEILANRVNRVTYEDGTQIVVNYNPDPYTGPGGPVDAYSYVLRKP
jgi:hypothetical protein